MFLTVFISFCCGIATCIFSFVYIFFFCLSSSNHNRKPWNEQYNKYSLPQSLKKAREDIEEGSTQDDGQYQGLNWIFQFLFQELKDTEHLRKWAVNKLHKEFADLLRTSAGKLIANISLRSISLGERLPVISNIVVARPTINENNFIHEVTLYFDIFYDGAFQLSVDVDTVFGKSVYLSVKIIKLIGKIKLNFTNFPFRHWSMAFIEEPFVEFEVDSKFEGRSITKISGIITNQIRKAIYKKHTLPNYKIRYKPFFSQSNTSFISQPTLLASQVISEGQLDVDQVICSNLLSAPKNSYIFCSLVLDSIPWNDLRHSRHGTFVSIDCQFDTSVALGMTFDDSFSVETCEKMVTITTVIPDSQADQLNMKEKDILISINGTRVSNSKYAAKLIRISKEKIIIRVERALTENFSFIFDFHRLNKEEKEKTQLEKPEQQELQDKQNLETKSGEKTNFPEPAITETVSYSNSLFSHDYNTHLNSQSDFSFLEPTNPPLFKYTPKSTFFSLNDRIFSTNKCRYIQSVAFKEHFKLKPASTDRFLNICIWCDKSEERSKSSSSDKIPKSSSVATEKLIRGSHQGKEMLLGSVSIGLDDLALECSLTSQGDVTKSLKISPSQSKTGTGQHIFPNHSNLSGFDEKLCHGDLILKFHYFFKSSSSAFFDSKSNSTLNLNSFPSPSSTSFSSISSMQTPELVTEKKKFSSAQNLLQKDLKKKKNPHCFTPSQLPSGVNCKFCLKKIWFKSAFMCKGCKIFCHKKCIEKCQAQMPCSYSGHSNTSFDSSQFEKSKASEDMNPDEHLILKARQVGKKLFSEFDLEQRKLKFDKAIANAQLEIEKETANLNELKKLENYHMTNTSLSTFKFETSNTGGAMKYKLTILKDKIRNSEEKLKSLKLILLQYCGGLQSCLDEEELLSKTNSKETLGKMDAFLNIEEGEKRKTDIENRIKDIHLNENNETLHHLKSNPDELKEEFSCYYERDSFNFDVCNEEVLYKINEDKNQEKNILNIENKKSNKNILFGFNEKTKNLFHLDNLIQLENVDTKLFDSNRKKTFPFDFLEDENHSDLFDNEKIDDHKNKNNKLENEKKKIDLNSNSKLYFTNSDKLLKKKSFSLSDNDFSEYKEDFFIQNSDNSNNSKATSQNTLNKFASLPHLSIKSPFFLDSIAKQKYLIENN